MATIYIFKIVYLIPLICVFGSFFLFYFINWKGYYEDYLLRLYLTDFGSKD